jgi:hypothetical protein
VTTGTRVRVVADPPPLTTPRDAQPTGRVADSGLASWSPFVAVMVDDSPWCGPALFLPSELEVVEC